MHRLNDKGNEPHIVKNDARHVDKCILYLRNNKVDHCFNELFSYICVATVACKCSLQSRSYRCLNLE